MASKKRFVLAPALMRSQVSESLPKIQALLQRKRVHRAKPFSLARMNLPVCIEPNLKLQVSREQSDIFSL
jgi:hypothetical protein